MIVRGKKSKKPKLAVVFVLAIAYIAWCMFKPLPNLKPATSTVVLTAKAPISELVWPASQAAVAIVGSDILETNNSTNQVATASTAKIITTLMILKQKPLKLGQQGPTITITDKDVSIYKDYVSRDGSVVPVQTGEKISQYQALQTVMLPSANNLADTLAIWAYGSLPNYAKAANEFLEQNGIDNTTVGSDASGLAANSVSTAEDLVKISNLAMQDPVFAQIAGQSTATGIPIVNNIKNVNDLIGMDGIIGIKTGNSDEAGGAFVGASKIKVNGKDVVIASAVVGAPSLFQSMKQYLPLNRSAQANFSPTSVVKKNQIVGKYTLPWGGTVETIVSSNLSIDAWNGSTLKATSTIEAIPASSAAGDKAGNVTINKSAINNKKSAAVILKTTPTKPSVLWRLTHPF